MKFPKKISLAKSPLQLKLDKEEARKTGRFVALFILLYLAVSVAFFAAIPQQHFQQLIAGITAGFFNATVQQAENPVLSLSNGPSIEISFLCTGLTELFIIVAAILASIGIPVKKRLAGAAIAAALVFGLNIFRIVATISIILATSSLETIELAHNVLFRIFLFVSIAAIYIAWFCWSVGSSPLEAGNKKFKY